MVTFLFIIIIIIAIYVFYKIYLKYEINHNVVDNENPLNQMDNMAVTFDQPKHKTLITEITKEDQQLFDDVVALFMAKKVQVSAKSQAIQIQDDVLRKMPLKAKACIQRNQQDGWSIYWVFAEQSLEYYVSRYGVFVTHVDREGKEYKETYLNTENRTSIFGLSKDEL